MVDVTDWSPHAERLSQRTLNQVSRGQKGSDILAIAAEVRALQAKGQAVANFTIGDFDPKIFPIPAVLRDRIKAELDAGQTNYPPADGLPELRRAIAGQYAEQLGIKYGEDCVLVASGARPPIYAAFRVLLDPGDVCLYPVPSWNVRYYLYYNDAQGIPIVTKPENGFLPTADELLPHLPKARLVVLNSPVNPCGTVMSEELLRDVCHAIVAENARRAETGERPVILLYDQVYWQLTFGSYQHFTPVGLVPEMAPYTVLVDAISKGWAATGLRVGWSVSPPWIRAAMANLIGHVGAWAGRAEQRATAAILSEPGSVAPFMATFRSETQARLVRLRDGLLAMKAEGLPVDCLDAQGAIYLSARFDLRGRTVGGAAITSDDALRSALLQHAGCAVVPFTAFGYPENTGWVRFSVGAVTLDDVDRSLERLRGLLRSL